MQQRYPVDYDLISDMADFKKDCPNYDYIPIVQKPVKRIIAIGDIHGDFNLTIDILKMAKIIDEQGEWIADPPNTHVVQVGDQIDRCRPISSPTACANPGETNPDEASDIKILKFFTNLHQKAKQHGGAVYSLLGNHEIMNVEGFMNYVSHDNIKDFENYKDPKKPDLVFKSGKDARLHAFKPGNEYADFLACTRTSAIIIGSNLFVHAGIIPKLTAEMKGKDPVQSMADVNKLVRKWLLGKIDHDSIKNLLDNPEVSPFWTRVLGYIPPGKDHPDCKKYLNEVLEIFHLGRMIIGHTPQLADGHGINSTCDKKLWRVDIGASKAFDKFSGKKIHKKRMQVLEIIDDNTIKILPIKSK